MGGGSGFSSSSPGAVGAVTVGSGSVGAGLGSSSGSAKAWLMSSGSSLITAEVAGGVMCEL